MLKTSLKPTDTLSATAIDDSKVDESSGGNEGKLAKSDFTKPVRGAEEPSFLTPKTREGFT